MIASLFSHWHFELVIVTDVLVNVSLLISKCKVVITHSALGAVTCILYMQLVFDE